MAAQAWVWAGGAGIIVILLLLGAAVLFGLVPVPFPMR
jgi:hypothetical protein